MIRKRGVAMRKRLTGTAQCRDFQVRYYLLEECSPEGTVYGVGSERDGESIELRDVTASRAQAQALLDSLARGQVTPAALRDVVEDWLLA